MRLEGRTIFQFLCASAATLLACCLVSGCQGDGRFFFTIVDGGADSFDASSGGGSGGSGAVGGSGGFATTDAGGDSGRDDDSGTEDAGLRAWISPFPNTGAPGWRDSQTPLCGAAGPGQRAYHVDVWSDAQNVYALVIGIPDPSANAPDHPGRCAGECTWLSLYRHQGQQWARVLNEVVPAPSVFDHDKLPDLAGVSDGPLFLFNAQVPTADNWECMLSTWDGDQLRCGAAGPQVPSVAVASDSVAYAANEATDVFVWNGLDWARDARSVPYSPQALWANEAVVFALGSKQLLRLSSAGWDEQAPSFSGATELWGRSTSDLWVGTQDGEVWRFDGQTWQQLGALGDPSCSVVDPVLGIWGTDESVYVFGERTLLRWTGNVMESLANWSCADSGPRFSIRGLWGNTHEEVFVGLLDNVTPSACDGAIVMRFDGRQFHRM